MVRLLPCPDCSAAIRSGQFAAGRYDAAHGALPWRGAPGGRTGEHGGSTLHAHFTTLDWLVLVVYLAFTTLLGAALAGRQATLRDFFLGGRKLPWWAVSGSIVATEISAVTLIGVPALVFAVGGDLRYLLFGGGAVLARLLIGVWFVPAYYEREIYSPYEFMGQRLGPRVQAVTSGLFVLGATLAQSVRVLLTAVVLTEIAPLSLVAAIWIIGAVAALWTLLGGIATVIWTDLIQFFVFLGAMVGALVLIVLDVPGGWGEVWRLAGAADKLHFWDGRFNPLDTTLVFTFWTGMIGNTLLCLGALGADQLMAQRIFCCRGPREARWAVLASTLGQVIAVLAAFVGLGLYAYYQHFPLPPAEAAALATESDRVFPRFIVSVVPVGLTGLIIAGLFAAAISSLDSALAALSQTTVAALTPWRRRTPEDGRAQMREARGWVVVWAVVLCGMAMISDLARAHYQQILALALAMATYVAGPLLAAFLLAFAQPGTGRPARVKDDAQLPPRRGIDDRGIIWSAPLAVLSVFGITWHQPWAQVVTLGGAAAVVLAWWLSGPAGAGRKSAEGVLPRGMQTALLMAGAAFAVGLCLLRLDTDGGVGWTWPWHTEVGQPLRIAWPWNVPLGFGVAISLGWLLACRRPVAQG